MRLLTTGLSLLRPTDDGDPPRRDGAPSLRPRDSASPPQPSRRAPLRNFATPMRLAGIALVLLAAAGYAAVYSGTTDRTPIVVVTRDLPSGAVVSASDLRVGELAGDRSVLDGLVPEQDLAGVVGRRLAAPVTSGAPLPRAALTRPVADDAAFTLTLPALRLGNVQVGDRVTILATHGAGSGRAQTKAVARGLQVLSLGSSAGSFDRATATVPVVLAVPDPSIAASLALANDAARVSLLLEGRRGTTRIPAAAEATAP